MIFRFHTAVLLLGLIGCTQAADPDWHKYTLSGTILARVDPAQDACLIGAWLWIPGELGQFWAGKTTLGFSRSQYRNGSWVSQDTNLPDHLVTITRPGLDSLRLTLGSPINQTLIGAWKGEAFEGEWSCDHSFPFAGDTAAGGRGPWALLP